MLLVLIWHYLASQVQTQAGSFISYGMKTFSIAWAGVDLFFVLSGFLLGGRLLDRRAAQYYFSGFYVRRFCRIFPLYYVMLGLFVAATALIPVGMGMEDGRAWLFSNPFPLWSYSTFLQNIPMALADSFGPNWLAVTWSLAVEEQFYLALPFVVRFVPVAILPWALVALIVSAPIFRGVLLGVTQNGIPGYVLLPGRWDSLFIGVLGALAIRRDSGRIWLRENISLIRWTVGACAGYHSWIGCNETGRYRVVWNVLVWPYGPGSAVSRCDPVGDGPKHRLDASFFSQCRSGLDRHGVIRNLSIASANFGTVARDLAWARPKNCQRLRRDGDAFGARRHSRNRGAFMART